MPSIQICRPDPGTPLVFSRVSDYRSTVVPIPSAMTHFLGRVEKDVALSIA